MKIEIDLQINDSSEFQDRPPNKNKNFSKNKKPKNCFRFFFNFLKFLKFLTINFC